VISTPSFVTFFGGGNLPPQAAGLGPTTGLSGMTLGWHQEANTVAIHNDNASMKSLVRICTPWRSDELKKSFTSTLASIVSYFKRDLLLPASALSS